MTDLDRRVAKWRGWVTATLDDDVIGPEQYWVKDGIAQWPVYSYQPHRVLKQAFALWDEARPEGWYMSTHLCFDGQWLVKVLSVRGTETIADQLTLADLPRAITEAWVEAKEAA